MKEAEKVKTRTKILSCITTVLIILAVVTFSIIVPKADALDIRLYLYIILLLTCLRLQSHYVVGLLFYYVLCFFIPPQEERFMAAFLPVAGYWASHTSKWKSPFEVGILFLIALVQVLFRYPPVLPLLYAMLSIVLGMSLIYFGWFLHIYGERDDLELEDD